MKKLIQISLLVMLVSMLLLTPAWAPNVSADQNSLNTAQNISAPANTTALICIGLKIAGCPVPQVGWNS